MKQKRWALEEAFDKMLSLILFSICAENLTEKLLEKRKRRKNKSVIMMENIVRLGKESEMKINVGKAKVIRIGKNGGFDNIFLKRKSVEKVNSFRYLRSMVTE